VIADLVVAKIVTRLRSEGLAAAVGGAPRATWPRQDWLQPAASFGGSHCSPGSMMPLPQMELQQVEEAPSCAHCASHWFEQQYGSAVHTQPSTDTRSHPVPC
jgi:hypothetical protein